jgi:hypothetical protein
LAAALRPGGWLVIDDYDLDPWGVSHPHDPTWASVVEAVRRVMVEAGADVEYGRKLPGALRSVGLENVDAEGRLVVQAAPATASVVVPVLRRLRPSILERGLATAAEVDQAIALFDDHESDVSIFLPVLVSARGRRSTPDGPVS